MTWLMTSLNTSLPMPGKTWLRASATASRASGSGLAKVASTNAATISSGSSDRKV